MNINALVPFQASAENPAILMLTSEYKKWSEQQRLENLAKQLSKDWKDLENLSLKEQFIQLREKAVKEHGFTATQSLFDDYNELSLTLGIEQGSQ